MFHLLHFPVFTHSLLVSQFSAQYIHHHGKNALWGIRNFGTLLVTPWLYMINDLSPEEGDIKGRGGDLKRTKHMTIS
jgi:hypothetical protein